jgi:hypothetical protein
LQVAWVERALALHLPKFAGVKALFGAPKNAGERAIAQRLWSMETSDAARGFGFRSALGPWSGSIPWRGPLFLSWADVGQ